MIYFNFIDFVLVLLFGLVLPFISGIQSHKGLDEIQFDAYSRKRFYYSNSLMLAGMAILILADWWFFKRPFQRMGFQLPTNTLLVYAAIALTCLLYVLDMIYTKMKVKKSAQSNTPIPFLPARWNEIPVYLIMCFSAAAFEEIIFRGFMVTYFIKPYEDGFPWMAVCFPATLFAMGHFYQGIGAVVKIFLLSALFALIFIYSGSLLYVMIIHFLIDLIGGMAAISSSKK